MTDTIAALATPPGRAALGLIRLSGPQAAEICDRLFRPVGNFTVPSSMEGYTLAYGTWHDLTGRMLDKLILAAFRAPHSYTGEDLYELSFHGGSQVKQSLLDSLYEAGARAAEPGEYSRRAFLNGKMDLVEAEAVMDLIDAESRWQQDLALKEIDGSLSRAIKYLQDEILRLWAALEFILDFSEEEIEQEEVGCIASDIHTASREIEQVLQGWTQGRIISESFKVCILGLPNAGKSTLLNSLLGIPRAIVSASSGTTRDTLSEKVQIQGIPVSFIDTAGLRVSSDPIEREGVNRALAAASQADLIIWLHDPQQLEASLTEFARWSSDASAGLPVLHLLGKQDLARDPTVRAEQWILLTERVSKDALLPWSYLEEDYLGAIREFIAQSYYRLGSARSGQLILHNARHKELLERTLALLRQAERSLQDTTLDVTAGLLRAAEEALAGIRGSTASERVVEEIFSRFCVGK